MNITNLMQPLTNLLDPRRVTYGNIRHNLIDIVIIGLCTMICGGEDYNGMEAFGLEREIGCALFSNCRAESRTGTLSGDCLSDLIRQNCRDACIWLEIERGKRSVVAIDGKTIRGSGNSKHKAYHVVSAFVAENQITLGELAVNEKSNEIIVIPELLDLIDVEGSIVTADAMSCQKERITRR